jgi:hypothetical protein
MTPLEMELELEQVQVQPWMVNAEALVNAEEAVAQALLESQLGQPLEQAEQMGVGVSELLVAVKAAQLVAVRLGLPQQVVELVAEQLV